MDSSNSSYSMNSQRQRKVREEAKQALIKQPTPSSHNAQNNSSDKSRQLSYSDSSEGADLQSRSGPSSSSDSREERKEAHPAVPRRRDSDCWFE